MKRQWDVNPVTFDPQTLWDGTGTFRLNAPRDLEVLRTLMDHNFLAPRHFVGLRLFPSAHRASWRLADLWGVGLVARTRTAVWQRGRRTNWQYTYAITQQGAELVGDYFGADVVPTGWNPPWENLGHRNNPVHDTAVADCVLSLMQYLGTKYTAAWQGPREATAVLGETGRVGGRTLVAPDASVIIAGPASQDVVFLEYEQSTRPEGVLRKLLGYQQLWLARPWHKQHPNLTAPPIVLWSVMVRSDRQGYWSNPFAEVKKLAAAYPVLYDHVWLTQEEEWRRGVWQAHSVRPDGKDQPLHALLTPMGKTHG